ncbi:MAG: branched-chain-amino-acid transaminase [Candidatus Omnitrophica bacterium]|nr:branched-chain-amino-acid transaminase [Candidatus Omnitrophota bacterium]MCM8809776.1 branched-chain-amino-acid transaminase [Candidatus Omnitrophota bacterium]MCM8810483.1 branched-chain-amino-acid transaminase [Candidatus Omnitrophota bacterium]
MGLIYLNGKFVDEKDAKISVFDHGLLYGDGVFEGLRSYNGKIFKLDEHINRLYKSAKAIFLEIPMKFEELKKTIIETVRKNNLKDSYIRVVVTRGVGDLGLDPRKCKKPTIFIVASKIQLYPESFYEMGIDVITVATRRNLNETVNPSIKSLNYLNNILAKIEANNAGATEGLILNQFGYVSECTGENVFIVKENNLITPPISAGVLEGVTRKVVMNIGENIGLKIKEENITRYDIYTSDECFLTGTAAEIVPVVSVDKRIIGDGKPGKITLKIREEFRLLTEIEGTPIYE